ncbi:MAG TPA: rhodanese-like domain-containing protein [Clostridiales bacterium]|nr:MAG: hypothetical protein A2Y18_07940 [Clostridiales bacterium GWD2_32_19]HCC07879.1 rhodanese-like domain-containing protein [Clostridiales bacterium]
MKILIIVLSVLMIVGLADDKKIQPIAENSKIIERNEVKDLIVNIRTLDQAIAKKNMDDNKDIILLDVRTVEEYKEVHIPNSILVTLNEIDEEIMSQKVPDKQSIIYTYCRSGIRSKMAYEILYKMGYENVYNIGGINTWSYETQRGN